MQMSHLYQTTNRKLRASRMRTDARECERAGYSVFASLLFEEAEWIDPTPREKPEQKQHRRASRGNQERQSSLPQHNPASNGGNPQKYGINQRNTSPIVEFKRKPNDNSAGGGSGVRNGTPGASNLARGQTTKAGAPRLPPRFHGVAAPLR